MKSSQKLRRRARDMFFCVGVGSRARPDRFLGVYWNFLSRNVRVFRPRSSHQFFVAPPQLRATPNSLYIVSSESACILYAEFATVQIVQKSKNVALRSAIRCGGF